MKNQALPEGYSVDGMTRGEAELLVEWAAAEGWNPGLADLDVAWGYDQQGFIGLRYAAPGNKPDFVGGGVILSYAGQCGFMGLFIMRADHRRQGLGRVLWHERLRRLRARLQPGAFIGMDGVFEMAPFYAAGGFAYQYRDLRFQGAANPEAPAVPAGVVTVPLANVGFDEVDAYDREVSCQPRADFLRRWLGVAGGHGLAVRGEAGGGLRGYAFLRPCVMGYKLGPVFADDAATARTLIHDLLARVPGQAVALDVPEPNIEAVAIAQELGWAQPFVCAKMFHGPSPPDTTHRVFGVTSFEFG